MADSTQVERLRDLLSQAVDCLGTASTSCGSSSTSTPGPSVTTSTSGSAQASVTGPPTFRPLIMDWRRAAQVRSERNTLFNFGSRKPTATKRVLGKTAPKSKKKKLPMWNHEFVCLANKNQEKTPTSFERSILIAAGMWFETK